MNLMNKTCRGTIVAQKWKDGLTLGLWNDRNFISLEYNPQSGALQLLIDKKYLDTNGIKIVDTSGTDAFH